MAKEKAGKAKALPDSLETKRTRMVCADRNYDTQTASSATQYMAMGVDNSYAFEQFKEEFTIEIRSINEQDHTMEFDLIGCDPAIANALRRILISDVPTMAVEHVFFINNTSIVQDEVLAHRLGLIPLNILPSLFEYKTAEEAPSEKNTVVMKLCIECKRTEDGVVNSAVYSRDLEWLPDGSNYPEETSCRFACGQDDLRPTDKGKSLGPVHDDILIAKLAPGQAIELEAHCTKGQGKEHAKWSPVATAWYKLKPEVVILKPVTGDLAKELVEECPGLFVLDKKGSAKATNPLDHLILLEKLRCMTCEPKWEPYVQLRKLKHHFMFTIESTGVLPPEELFKQALDILEAKCTGVLNRL